MNEMLLREYRRDVNILRVILFRARGNEGRAVLLLRENSHTYVRRRIFYVGTVIFYQQNLIFKNEFSLRVFKRARI